MLEKIQPQRHRNHGGCTEVHDVISGIRDNEIRPLLKRRYSPSNLRRWTPAGASVESKQSKPWRAVHLLDYNTDSALDALGQNLETLAKQGINVIILEVDYNFAFKSHPELRRGTNPITRDGARRFAALCRKFNIRLIPEFQSLGHQSWKA